MLGVCCGRVCARFGCFSGIVAVIIIAAILGGWMLSWEDDVEAHALRRRGWSISAIARHLGHDRKTVRAYLRGDREPGRRGQPGPGCHGAVRGVLPDPAG
jgi:hypothetical protein